MALVAIADNMANYDKYSWSQAHPAEHFDSETGHIRVKSETVPGETIGCNSQDDFCTNKAGRLINTASHPLLNESRALQEYMADNGIFSRRDVAEEAFKHGHLVIPETLSKLRDPLLRREDIQDYFQGMYDNNKPIPPELEQRLQEHLSKQAYHTMSNLGMDQQEQGTIDDTVYNLNHMFKAEGEPPQLSEPNNIHPLSEKHALELKRDDHLKANILHTDARASLLNSLINLSPEEMKHVVKLYNFHDNLAKGHKKVSEALSRELFKRFAQPGQNAPSWGLSHNRRWLVLMRQIESAKARLVPGQTIPLDDTLTKSEEGMNTLEKNDVNPDDLLREAREHYKAFLNHWNNRNFMVEQKNHMVKNGTATVDNPDFHKVSKAKDFHHYRARRHSEEAQKLVDVAMKMKGVNPMHVPALKTLFQLGDDEASAKGETNQPLPIDSKLYKAIEDLQPAEKPEKTKSFGDTQGNKFEDNSFDYTHLLPDKAIQAGYKMKLTHSKTSNPRQADMHALYAEIKGPDDESVGHFASFVKPGGLIKISAASVNRDHRGTQSKSGGGLGMAGYEALYTHALHHLGVHMATGETHSSSAQKAHERLLAKHGLQWHQKPLENKDVISNKHGEMDDKFGSYSYPLTNK